MISNIFNVKSIYKDNENVLLFWQKKIFKILFLSLLIIGCIPFILSCIYAVKQSQWILIFVFISVYLWGIGVTFLEKIPFKIRVWAGLFAFYFLGINSLLTTGLAGSARLYLFCFSAFAAIFSNLKTSLITLIISCSTLVIFGILFSKNFLSVTQMQGISNAQEWFVFTATFFFLCTAIIVSLSVLIKALEVCCDEFKHLIKNTTDIIWTLDKNLNITFINSAVFSLLGYNQKEWIGLPLNRFLNKTDGRRFKKKIKKNDTFKIQAVILHQDGTPIDVEINGTLIQHFHSKQYIYQGIIRDITQQKHQEKEQQRLKEKLIQAEKFKALGILSGSVAHDLNNILSGIATYPEVLLMDTTLDPAIEKGLNIIKDSGRKASAVVSDLLTISRGSNTEKEIVNINTVLERYANAHDFIKIEKSYPNVTIELMTEPELLNIFGSYIHIEKSIMNLVLNAVEEVSTRKGGQVLISTANTYLDTVIPGHENRQPGEYAVLSVTDNGSGITKENQKKIFEPFYTKKQMGKSGTGLGLTVVWNAVQDHFGYVDVTSSPKGTTFDLIFPATRKEIPRLPESGSLDEIMGQGQMILIVDDLADQQSIALSILENLGYKAQAVDNGYDAVEFIKQTPTDLVILDMIMAPSISGLETYRLIKEINPGQKAIIASGYAESDEVLTAQHLGAGSFVKKPYTILDMGIAVKEELEK
ncbi:MAG: ATP-binding protein [Desulfobacula sp.]|nr:ATP-binding protein [Desulfobacula sp.]